MKRSELIGLITGGAVLIGAVVFSLVNGGRPVGGSSAVEEFACEVGREVAGIADSGGRSLGEIAEAWASGKR